MRKAWVLAIVFMFVCCFLPQEGNAEISLLSPENESVHSTPPTFSWTPGQYNMHIFISVFSYDLPGFSGYQLVKFFNIGSSFPLPAAWWNAIEAGKPCIWAVYELNDQGGVISDVYWFMKAAQP